MGMHLDSFSNFVGVCNSNLEVRADTSGITLQEQMIGQSAYAQQEAPLLPHH